MLVPFSFSLTKWSPHVCITRFPAILRLTSHARTGLEPGFLYNEISLHAKNTSIDAFLVSVFVSIQQKDLVLNLKTVLIACCISFTFENGFD